MDTDLNLNLMSFCFCKSSYRWPQLPEALLALLARDEPGYGQTGAHHWSLTPHLTACLEEVQWCKMGLNSGVCQEFQWSDWSVPLQSFLCCISSVIKFNIGSACFCPQDASCALKLASVGARYSSCLGLAKLCASAFTHTPQVSKSTVSKSGRWWCVCFTS